MTAALSKTASVLKLAGIGEDDVCVGFNNFEEDVDPKDTDPRGYRSILLTIDTWEDLGRPQEITVTVEPGNTLMPQLVPGSLTFPPALAVAEAKRR